MYGKIRLKGEGCSVEEEEGNLQGQEVHVRPHDGGQDGPSSTIQYLYNYLAVTYKDIDPASLYTICRQYFTVYSHLAVLYKDFRFSQFMYNKPEELYNKSAVLCIQWYN